MLEHRPWNLLFKGVIGGLITALVTEMGIVLVYRVEAE